MLLTSLLHLLFHSFLVYELLFSSFFLLFFSLFFFEFFLLSQFFNAFNSFSACELIPKTSCSYHVLLVCSLFYEIFAQVSHANWWECGFLFAIRIYGNIVFFVILLTIAIIRLLDTALIFIFLFRVVRIGSPLRPSLLCLLGLLFLGCNLPLLLPQLLFSTDYSFLAVLFKYDILLSQA